MKPKLLSLFCGCGGDSVGYARAGFEVTGVDLEPQPNYPYTFIQADVMEVLKDKAFLQGFEVIHASPPCQQYSIAGKKTKKEEAHTLTVLPTVKAALQATGKIYVIENVEQAVKFGHLRADVSLVGYNFPNLRVIRKRCFEIGSAFVFNPPKAKNPFTVDSGDFVIVAGYGWHKRQKKFKNKLREYKHLSISRNKEIAMCIDWLKKGTAQKRHKEINNAIPPQYTRFIGEQLMSFVGTQTKE
jgi:DNA (cytosine-5)-methyltransferase 1